MSSNPGEHGKGTKADMDTTATQTGFAGIQGSTATPTTTTAAPSCPPESLRPASDDLPSTSSNLPPATPISTSRPVWSNRRDWSGYTEEQLINICQQNCLTWQEMSDLPDLTPIYKKLEDDAAIHGATRKKVKEFTAAFRALKDRRATRSLPTPMYLVTPAVRSQLSLPTPDVPGLDDNNAIVRTPPLFATDSTNHLVAHNDDIDKDFIAFGSPKTLQGGHASRTSSAPLDAISLPPPSLNPSGLDNATFIPATSMTFAAPSSTDPLEQEHHDDKSKTAPGHVVSVTGAVLHDQLLVKPHVFIEKVYLEIKSDTFTNLCVMYAAWLTKDVVMGSNDVAFYILFPDSDQGYRTAFKFFKAFMTKKFQGHTYPMVLVWKKAVKASCHGAEHWITNTAR